VADIVLSSEELLKSHYKTFKVPVIIAHGTKDNTTCPKASAKFIAQCASVDKTFKEYIGGYHELHNEPVDVRTKVFEEYVQWITARADL
jgi:acylglycerol lipase